MMKVSLWTHRDRLRPGQLLARPSWLDTPISLSTEMVGFAAVRPLRPVLVTALNCLCPSNKAKGMPVGVNHWSLRTSPQARCSVPLARRFQALYLAWHTC